MNRNRTQRTRGESDFDRAWNQGPPRRHPWEQRGRGDTRHNDNRRRPWPTSPAQDQFGDRHPDQNRADEDMSNYGVGGYYGNTYRQESYRRERERPRIGLGQHDDQRRAQYHHGPNEQRWPRAHEQRAHDEVNNRGKGPRGYQRADKRIREDISDRLFDDTFIDATDIEVYVDDAEVTLKGTVDSRDAKRKAEALSEAVSGVKHVENRLRVRTRPALSDQRDRRGYASR